MQRHIKGIWIPIEVWTDSRLTPLDKIILMEIDSLDDGETGCYATDKYIANFAQCSVDKVSQAVQKLSDLGLIQVEKKKSRYRRIRSIYSVKFTELSELYSVKNTECYSAKNTECNIDNNRTDKNTSLPPTPYNEIVEIYNMNCPTLPKCRELTSSRKKAIKAVWEQHPQMEYYFDIFSRMGRSAFLNGKNDKGWKANFDFWLREDKRSKILEGFYDSQQPTKPTSFDTNEFFRKAVERK